MRRSRFIKGLILIVSWPFVGFAGSAWAQGETVGLDARERQTIAAAAEAFLGGRDAMFVSPEQVASNVAQLLAAVPADVASDFRTMAYALEWWMPLLILHVRPFSALTVRKRRIILEKCVRFQGGWLPLNDVARGVKTLSCAGYYGDETVKRMIGFVPFEERPRHVGADETPATYPDPFLVKR